MRDAVLVPLVAFLSMLTYYVSILLMQAVT